VVLVQWLWEGFVAGVAKVATLWWLVPLFIVIQVLKDSGWLNKVSGWMKPILAPLRLPGEAGLPTVAAVTVGLTYGSGIILQTAEEGNLTRNELTVLCIFVGICHAIIEETILFSAVGVNGFMLLGIRFVTGALFGMVASWVLLAGAGTRAQRV
jgi:spore maturation protein SpmB